MDKRHWEHGPCPKHDCRKDSCKCGLRLISFPAALGDDSKGSPVAPKNGDYCNALVKYESNGHIYVYSTEGVPALIYDGDSGCECDSNIVVGLENGMTTYPAGTAPISFDDALAAFQNGQSIFFTDHTFRMDDMYTVSAIESHDGIWSMKVERVGMDLQNDEGFWVVKAHNPTEWRSVDFFKSVTDPATETQVETVVSKIGDLEDLQTTDKDTVVGAINEIVSGGGGGGTSNYNQLSNKPSINGVTLQGNLTASALGINEYDDTQIKQDISTLQGSVSTNTNNIGTLQTGLSTEISNRENADNNLQSQIDAITVSSDVVDVLGTYAELQAYDTSHIKANDIVKVIQDSTHNNAMSYYRWVITNNVGAWSYVGSEGPFYTKSETDTLLNAKANTSDIIVYTAGTGISIQNGVISLSLTSAESEPF